jgi:hypothetical protein
MTRYCPPPGAAGASGSASPSPGCRRATALFTTHVVSAGDYLISGIPHGVRAAGEQGRIHLRCFGGMALALMARDRLRAEITAWGLSGQRGTRQQGAISRPAVADRFRWAPWAARCARSTNDARRVAFASLGSFGLGNVTGSVRRVHVALWVSSASSAPTEALSRPATSAAASDLTSRWSWRSFLFPAVPQAVAAPGVAGHLGEDDELRRGSGANRGRGPCCPG